MAAEKTKNANAIETDFLKVRGNLIIWENTMIQISNISMISTDNILGEPLPLWAAAVAVLGVLCFMVNPIIAVGMIVIGGAVLFSWSKKDQERKQSKMLTFMLNSGNRFSLVFRNQEFLQKVSSVLTELLAEEKVNTNIMFNIKNSTISNSTLIGKDEK